MEYLCLIFNQVFRGNQESNDEIKILYENWLYHKAKIIFKEKVHILSKAIGVKAN